MILTTSTNTESNLVDRHVESVRAGFASIGNSEPRRRFTGAMPPELRDQPTAPEPMESTPARVLREAGIVARDNLMGLGLANVEALTTGLLTKKETARLIEIQTALDRLADGINQVNMTPINPAKLAATFPAGELPTEEAIAAVVAGDEGRQARRRLAKESARRFFEEQGRPLILAIFAKVADLLAAKITDRLKAEKEAFDRLLEIYGDEDSTAYQPSPGLLRLCARRRQLLDGEIGLSSPPSIRTSLSQIVAFPAP
jgi:hypothetical protein